MDKIIKQIAEELEIRENQVKNTINLIDEGNTIPFIARYRKEVTGGLSDEVLRAFGERLTYLRREKSWCYKNYRWTRKINRRNRWGTRKCKDYFRGWRYL